MSSKKHSGPIAKPGSPVAMSQAAASSTTLDGGITKDSFIPLFDGQPQSYQEWRKRINIYHLKMKLQKRTAESILNIIGSLQGTAWRLVENYDLTKIDADSAFDDLMKTLDKAFQYDARVRLPQDFDGYFSHLSRKPGETLLSFITNHDEKLRKVEEHGIKIPDEVQGWLLLKKANVTREQRQMVVTQAPKLEKLRVQESLFLILGQDHKAAVSPLDRRPGSGRLFRRGAYAAEDDEYDEGDCDEGYDAYYEYDDMDDGVTYDESWADESQFDADAAYYEASEAGPSEGADYDVEAYDEAFAAYLDARRRFQDLKISRGFYPVVALADQSPTHAGPQLPIGRGKGSGGGKPKGKGRGKGKNMVKYPRFPGKAADPRGRAAASMQCLRCGAPGHQAANCPKQKHPAPASNPPSPKKQHTTEGMAVTTLPEERGLVIFEDEAGRQRVDCTMLDPGASAFLMGSGPFHRYVQHLQDLGYPVDSLKMQRCSRTFHFGGDHSTTSHWIATIPIFVNSVMGFAQAFIIKGETPMLMGRPIIEELGIVVNFKCRTMMFEGRPWRPISMGMHGEYLLSLTEDFDHELIGQPPCFELNLVDAQKTDDAPAEVLDFSTYRQEENVFQSSEEPGLAPTVGDRKIVSKLWRSFEVALATSENDLHKHVSQELQNLKPRPRLIWEVYAGASRLAEVADSLGCQVESFGYETGWDFDLESHRSQFLAKLDEEMPDEVWLAPRCGLWSKMMNVNATTPEKQFELQRQRQIHHDTHLHFCRTIFVRQVRHGRHAHLEQPQGACSWHTRALSSLPGQRVTFDQCRYGVRCKDQDHTWQLVRKTTSLQTTKRAVMQAMNLRCDRTHRHCQLEGQVPGFGISRTSFLEDYQPCLAATMAAALAVPESAVFWEDALAVNEDKLIHGKMIQLLTGNKAEAVRAVQRLHRNLGHPTTTALVEMLEARGASSAVLEVARTFQCHACLKYRKPNQVAPASTKVISRFNQSIQADVMWIKSAQNKFPILSIVDEGTRFQVAVLINTEKADEYITALERHWIAPFGIPQRLITDEGRGWLNDSFGEWTDAQSIQHLVAAGEAHEQLALVERRHAVLRKAVEVFLMDFGLEGGNAIRQALAYVVPQINNTPSTSGYSPAQWVLGQSPNFPGELLGTNLTPVHLDVPFEDELSKRAVAKMAIVQAEMDQKLRRALLRKYAGTNTVLHPGQPCFFWRDAQAPDLIKIRWKGPATVIMREDNPDGKPAIYWLGYKSQLLRCAPHHVRPEIGRSSSTLLGDLKVAKDVVQKLRSRGVTHFADLTIKNRNNIDDFGSGDEVMDELDSEVEEPPTRRRRLVDPQFEPPAQPAQSPGSYEPSLARTEDLATAEAILDDPQLESPGLMDSVPTGLSEPASAPHANAESPGLVTPAAPGLGLLEPGLSDVAIHDSPLSLTSPAETPSVIREIRDDSILGTEPSREPSPRHEVAPPMVPPTMATPPAPTPGLDSITASFYQPATHEDFRAHRRRVAQQETMSLRSHGFGPIRNRQEPAERPQADPPREHGPGPYSEDAGFGFSAIDIQDMDSTQLPPGWKFEDGYVVMNDTNKDHWELKSGCLIRHHVVPRRTRFDPSKLSAREQAHMPIPLSHLDDVRVTVCRGQDGVKHFCDTSKDVAEVSGKPWIGCTVFQINGESRRELGMHAYAVSTAKQVGKQQKVHTKRKFKKDQNKNDLSERNMSLEDKLLFQKAKMDELRSFFSNGVWSFQTTREADPQRTLSSRILLKWSRNPDGSPRAKARLVVRGYTDADALAGQLDTASPASSRLGRGCLLSISACLSWCGWSADVATAFLQGLPQERLLWVKLPPDAVRLLGGDENTRMLLHKPCYGQLDAPKRWHMEAARRLKDLGWVPHPMDPCLWLLYEPAQGDAVPALCGLLALHVDDMLGAGDPKSPTYMAAEAALKQAFNFRTWQKDEPFDYCGAKMTRDEDGTWHISHKEYLSKVSPLSIGKDRQPHQPMSEKEHTMLRQLLGSLQWPAVQTSPHLQASTSLLSGEMSTGLSSPLIEVNKLLRFAKSNSDVHLRFPPLGRLEDLRLTCMFDAALGVRHDQASQGGFVILLTNKSAFEGVETPYHVLEWRSFKLPRIARSSLSAEAQSAATAVDSTEFVVRFWHMIFNPQDSLKDTLQAKNPTLSPTFITDAKALYDSYHRDAINHGATDKRTNLELRVVREQVEGMNGVLKWISSERQFGDGLTKISARQLLCDRLRHGAIKFTFDPGYTAAKKKTAKQREKSRNEFATTTNKSTSTPFSTNQPHVATADVNEMHVAAEDENTAGPDVTSKGIDVDDVYGSVDAIHACKEQRLLPADEHVFESKQATEEPFFPVNSQLSKPNDVFVKDIAPAEIQAFEYNQVSEYNMAHDLNAAVVNTKMPVESYARASHVVRFCFSAVLMAALPAVAQGADLLPMTQQHVCDVAIETPRLPLDEPNSWMPSKALAMLLFLLLSVLALGMTVWFLKKANRCLKIQLDEERARATRFSQDLEQSNYERDEYKGFWNSTMDENATLQLELDRTNGLFEETRAASQRALRSAKGLLDRALDEMVDFREMHGFHTPGGRCWHVIPDCPTLVNSPRVHDRAACSVCFNTHVTPLKRNETSGTTLEEDCRAFFQRHGGRVNYLHTIVP